MRSAGAIGLVGRVGLVGLILAAALTPTCAVALMQAEALTLEYQVRNSDVVLRGKCEDSTTTWSNKNLVTTYKFSVRKYLKSPGKITLKSKPVVQVSQLGGRLTYPLPLEQSYPEMVAIFPGEEVVLFLQSPDSAPAAVRNRHEQYVRQGQARPSPLMENFRLTTMNVSKMTVVTDPQSGRELVTRVNFDRLGLLPDGDVLKRYIETYQSGGQFLDVGGKRLPVALDKAAGLTGPSAGVDELRVQQLKSYTTTWSGFESAVQAIVQRQGPQEKSQTPSR